MAPDPPGPALACPADLELQARNGRPAVAEFDRPAAQGGLSPVNVTCTPESGTSFDVGTHTVTCTARDAKARAATCSFEVQVSAVPRLSEVKFLAFGDSLTEGKVSSDPDTLAVNFPQSYPNKLQRALSERYIDQTIRVIPEGLGGEKVAGEGEERFPPVLDRHRPDVVLLLHGANDLLAAAGRGDPWDAIPDILDGLESIIESATRRRVPVMVATFPPQNEDAPKGRGAPAIPDLNRAIRSLARREGARVVDLFGGLDGTPEGSIGVDGLHPTADGYTKIAEVWFEAIQRAYEVPDTAATARFRLLISPAEP